MTGIAAAPTAPPLAPFKHRVFFWLWLGVVCASIGYWGQTVGAQWLFVNDPQAATIVPLVQTAGTLPIMLLALPAGVLADAFDRRWMMLVIQVYVIVVAVLLAVLTAADMMPPALLLTFVFAGGAGLAMTAPAWQSLITELVPRDEIAAATRLDMVSVNVSRAAGPAIAGFVIAAWGVPPVFLLNAATSTVLAVVLLVRPFIFTFAVARDDGNYPVAEAARVDAGRFWPRWCWRRGTASRARCRARTGCSAWRSWPRSFPGRRPTRS